MKLTVGGTWTSTGVVGAGAEVGCPDPPQATSAQDGVSSKIPYQVTRLHIDNNTRYITLFSLWG